MNWNPNCSLNIHKEYFKIVEVKVLQYSRIKISGFYMRLFCFYKAVLYGDFLDDAVVKNPPCNKGFMGSIPGWGAEMPQARWHPYTLHQKKRTICIDKDHTNC